MVPACWNVHLDLGRIVKVQAMAEDGHSFKREVVIRVTSTGKHKSEIQSSTDVLVRRFVCLVWGDPVD